LSHFALRSRAGAASKDMRGFPISMRDHYLTRAAEFHARSRNEYEEKARHEYENLARQYLRLAKQAERNTWADVTYEPPPKIRRQS
ncbi:MAG: hypothetical protein WBW27_24525, partial [Pseudolabrys sp.]